MTLKKKEWFVSIHKDFVHHELKLLLGKYREYGITLTLEKVDNQHAIFKAKTKKEVTFDEIEF
jgi:deoxyribodipyrimidine photolyase